jgi:hypothetical protein
MNSECYTIEEMDALTTDQRAALRGIADHRGIDLDSEDTPLGEETIQEAFRLFQPCEGCIPEDEIGDDVCLSVREKFACVYGAALEIAEADLRNEGYFADCHLGLRLVIDASYEDQTTVAVVDWSPEQRPFCYLQESHKAWRYSFETLSALADEVLAIHNRLMENVRRLIPLGNRS